MHTYSLDSDCREKIVIGIFVLSVLVTLGLNFIYDKYLVECVASMIDSCPKTLVIMLTWLDVVPDFLVIPFWYGLLSLIYNNWGWKLKFVKRIHGIPDLNGQWAGELISSYNGECIPMEMNIKQTWNKISFESKFPKTKSFSYSNMAAVYINANGGKRICFGFTNESRDVATGLQTYDGYNTLNLENENRIVARYFNNREDRRLKSGSGNKGCYELTRKV